MFKRITTPQAIRLTIAAVLLPLAPAALADPATYENDPINYSKSATHDSASALKRDLESGKSHVARNTQHGYLDDLLKALHISPSSQTLVFSKTSFQQTRISPTNPRALYFNDETYVGYVPGGDVIEIASTDPHLGTTFYTLDQHNGDEGKPKVARQTDNCLQCHGEAMTRDIPGLLIRSVFPDADGQPIFPAGTFITTQESPFAERWGGWYITGQTSPLKHMGNTSFTADDPQNPKRLTPAADLHDLSAQIDTTKYLTPQSDAVALLVLEHQTETHNRITRADFGTLLALRDEKVLADALGEKIDHHSESTVSRIKSACEPLVEALLFANDPQFPAPIQGSSNFTKEFPQSGPRDSKTRSLRDLDLQTRLFKYPCSYLIYSASFEGLPEAAKAHVYSRLHEILTGTDTTKPFAHLTPTDRIAITEILRDTKPQFRSAYPHQ